MTRRRAPRAHAGVLLPADRRRRRAAHPQGAQVPARARLAGHRDHDRLPRLPGERPVAARRRSRAGTRVVRAAEPAVWRVLVTGALLALQAAAAAALRPLPAWPDACWPWGPFALLAALREVRRARPDVIYSTSPPHTAHLVGWIVHRLTGIPWVCDFRDEWSAQPAHRDQPRARRDGSAAAPSARSHARAARVTVVADCFGSPARRRSRRWSSRTGSTRTTSRVGGRRPARRGRAAAAQPRRHALRRPRLRAGASPRSGACSPTAGSRRGDSSCGSSATTGSLDLDARVPVASARPGTSTTARRSRRCARPTRCCFYVAPASLAPSGKLFEYLASGRPILCVTRRDNLAAAARARVGRGHLARPRTTAPRSSGRSSSCSPASVRARSRCPGCPRAHAGAVLAAGAGRAARRGAAAPPPAGAQSAALRTVAIRWARSAGTAAASSASQRPRAASGAQLRSQRDRAVAELAVRPQAPQLGRARSASSA